VRLGINDVCTTFKLIQLRIAIIFDYERQLHSIPIIQVFSRMRRISTDYYHPQHAYTMYPLSSEPLPWRSCISVTFCQSYDPPPFQPAPSQSLTKTLFRNQMRTRTGLKLLHSIHGFPSSGQVLPTPSSILSSFSMPWIISVRSLAQEVVMPAKVDSRERLESWMVGSCSMGDCSSGWLD
jgi:hypothetical protein